MSVAMTSSSMITGDAFEAVEFSDSDTDSWQVVDDPFDSENDDVITTESDAITSDEEDDDEEFIDQKAAVELNSSMNGRGDPYRELSDAMKEDMYLEYMLTERALDEVEEEEEEEDEDLDDELVPRWLNNKFERQRMRKLGKK
ncbi:hypothetical protein Tco_1141324, partial [Tanacetum coccineum]